MNIPLKYRNIIKSIHKYPTFKIEMDGQESDWKKQEAGIRQGCPLSPYLFLIVMTVMLHDIHEDKLLNRNLQEDRILGSLLDGILYADDTIIHSTAPEKVLLLLNKIETEGAKYGLKLNHKKCEALAVRDHGTGGVHFLNGERVNELNESKYLGCFINNETKQKRESQQTNGRCVCHLEKTGRLLETHGMHD